jgi:molybdopterin-guanine dinucleotide biosynthesis protein A
MPATSAIPAGPAIRADQVCAVVLAGGEGRRMGGVDKGLQILQGRALARHALERLQQQTLGVPRTLAINANRNQEGYAAWGFPVWSDAVGGFAGPLAGFHTTLEHCAATHDYLLTVPCDSPLFPLDLLARLAQALATGQGDVAMACAPDGPQDRSVRRQPVFCLLKTSLYTSLTQYLHAGGRKIDAWTQVQRQVDVAFNLAQDDPRAFFNANTLAELHMLEDPAATRP